MSSTFSPKLMFRVALAATCSFRTTMTQIIIPIPISDDYFEFVQNSICGSEQSISRGSINFEPETTCSLQYWNIDAALLQTMANILSVRRTGYISLKNNRTYRNYLLVNQTLMNNESHPVKGWIHRIVIATSLVSSNFRQRQRLYMCIYSASINLNKAARWFGKTILGTSCARSLAFPAC